MHYLKTISYKPVVTLLILAILVVNLMGCSSVAAKDTEEIDAEVTTGVNRLYGQPLLEFDFMPSPFKEKFGFETMGVFNPDGDNPTQLTSSTPDSAILASLVDANGVGLPPAILENPDPALVNVPLREIATWVLPPTLLMRTSLPPHLTGPVTGPTQAEPNSPITKGDWFKASGKMKVKCNPNGNSVTIRVKDLIPNRVYTVWALWLDPSGAGSVTPLPLGGAPNSYVTDGKGDATFERDLNFCPWDAAQDGVDGKRLVIIDTHLHSDHSAYGSIPAPFAAGLPPGSLLVNLPPGSVLHEHLSWDLGAGQHR